MSGLDPDINLCQDLMSGSDVHFSVGFPILRNASQQKREIELKRTVINTDCQILRNT